MNGCKEPMECSKYKTGRFVYVSTENNHKILVIRDGSTQLEEDVTGDVTVKEKISWTSPCSFDTKEIRKVTDSSVIELNAPVPIHITIAKVAGNSYNSEMEYIDSKNKKVNSSVVVKALKFDDK